MILLGNLLIGVGQVLSSVVTILYIILFVRAIISWFSPDPRNQLVQFLSSVTEPILQPVRKRIPPFGMIDMSIIVVFLGLLLLESVLVASMIDYGYVIKNSAGPATITAN